VTLLLETSREDRPRSGAASRGGAEAESIRGDRRVVRQHRKSRSRCCGWQLTAINARARPRLHAIASH
jgi:hypothetical protein